MPIMRLARPGTSTLGHLVPALRVVGLCAGLWLDVYEGGYRRMLQAFDNPRSGLHAFHADAVLFAQDSERLSRGATLETLHDELVALWRKARVVEEGARSLLAFGLCADQRQRLPSRPRIL